MPPTCNARSFSRARTAPPRQPPTASSATRTSTSSPTSWPTSAAWWSRTSSGCRTSNTSAGTSVRSTTSSARSCVGPTARSHPAPARRESTCERPPTWWESSAWWRRRAPAGTSSRLEVEILRFALLEPELVVLGRVLQKLGRVGEDVLVALSFLLFFPFATVFDVLRRRPLVGDRVLARRLFPLVRRLGLSDLVREGMLDRVERFDRRLEWHRALGLDSRELL